MKFEINLNWAWIIRQLFSLAVVAVFILLYHYLQPLVAFAFAFWVIHKDMTDTQVEVLEIKETVDKESELWKNISNIRKRI